MRRLIGTLFASVVLFAPLSVIAQDRNVRTERYYDRSHKDWHEWNDNERGAYRQYLTEHRLREQEFARARARQRNEYFRWRHNHQEFDRH